MNASEILEACQRRAQHWRLAERQWKLAFNAPAAQAGAEQAEWCERRIAQLKTDH